MNGMDQQTLKKYRDFAVAVTHGAGKIILEYFDSRDQGRMIKADNSPVTIADMKANHYVIERVKEYFPKHGVLGEEESNVDPESHKDLWLCDPIDGTAAFTWGLPTGVTSLAYVRDGVPLLGVVYDPYLKRTYTAIKGHGAFMNDRRIDVSVHGLRGGTLGINQIDSYRFRSFYGDLRARGVHLATYSGLVYQAMTVATGRIVGRVFTHIGPHDVAALKVIVEEAGGVVTDLEGNEQRYDGPINGAIISNKVAHHELLDMVAKHGVQVV